MQTLKVDWGEFRRGWKILLSCTIGVITSAAAMPLYTFGPLVTPLQQAFGWTRGDVQSTISLFFIGLMVGAPLAGWMVARFGPRRSAIVSAIGQTLVYVVLTQLTQSIWYLYVIYFLLPVIGAGTQHVTWTQLTGACFIRNRGLALALVLTGTGLCALIVTPLVAKAIEMGGWQWAVWLLACIPVFVTIPAVFLCIPRANAELAAADAHFSVDAAPASDVNSHRRLSIAATLRARKFWFITIGLSLTVVGIVGLITNIVPLLRDKGMPAITAASIFSMVGISLIVGRMIAGYLIDRLWAPGIAFVSLILPAFGCLILIFEAKTIWLFNLAAMLIGFGAGAEFDFASFLIARYFGLINYSRIYSVFTAFVALLTCAAPLLFGRLYDATGAYTAMLWVCSTLFVIGPTMLLALGPYPKDTDS